MVFLDKKRWYLCINLGSDVSCHVARRQSKLNDPEGRPGNLCQGSLENLRTNRTKYMRNSRSRAAGHWTETPCVMH